MSVQNGSGDVAPAGPGADGEPDGGTRSTERKPVRMGLSGRLGTAVAKALTSGRRRAVAAAALAVLTLGGLALLATRPPDLHPRCPEGDARCCRDVGAELVGQGRIDAAIPYLADAALSFEGGMDRAALDSALKTALVDTGGLAAQARSACERNRPFGCYVLALLQGKPAGPYALGVLRARCEQGDLVGCVDEANWTLHGMWGVPRDEKRASELYERACDGANPAGCNNLGWAWQNGRGGLAKDDRRAAELYRRACDGGHPPGCTNLGWAYQNGLGGLAKDDRRAAELYQQACDGGDPAGCNNLGSFYQNGEGGRARDDTRAAELHRRACDRGYPLGCTNLGWAYQNGHGGLAKSDNRAAELYLQACDGGDPAGCNNLGSFYQTGRGGLAKDQRRAADLYRRACDRGHLPGCTNLGVAKP